MEDIQREWKLRRIKLFYRLMGERAIETAPDKFWFELTSEEFWRVFNHLFADPEWLEFEKKRMESGLFKESTLSRG